MTAAGTCEDQGGAVPSRSGAGLAEPASPKRWTPVGCWVRLGVGASAAVLLATIPAAMAAAAPMARREGADGRVAHAAEATAKPTRVAAQPRTFVVSTTADLIRAGGTSGFATGGGLFVGLLTGPLAGVPVAGPTLADQFTKGWSQSQSTAGDGAKALAGAVAQAGTPLAPVLNPVGAPIVAASDSLSESGAAAEELMSKFGAQTNFVSAPLKYGAQLAHAMN
jgi:hypothetical protein